MTPPRRPPLVLALDIAAAVGWDGDKFVVFEGAQGKLGLVWFSTWDSEQDAREYLSAYVRYQSKKLGPDVQAPDAISDSIRRPSAGVYYATERRGADVVVVEAGAGLFDGRFDNTDEGSAAEVAKWLGAPVVEGRSRPGRATDGRRQEPLRRRM
jgi:hypothetical protein